MINKIRLIISNFIKKHKAKIMDLGKKLIMVAMGIFIAIIVLSSLSGLVDTETDEEIYNVYKPTETVIKGSDISKEQYEKDSNLVDTFLDFCNEKEIEKAYNLLSNTCKEEAYPTIETFKTNYYNTIFDIKREFNLQSWISTEEYTVYKIRYSNRMLSTGVYQKDNVYEDYITLNRREETEKISIGNFIDLEKCDIVTETDEMVVTVVKKRQYMTYEEYDLHIKNNTSNTILLNNLENTESIKLIGEAGTQYGCYTNKLFLKDLIISPNGSQEITIRFKKNFSSSKSSKKISIIGVIKDYNEYMKDEKNYKDITNITIKVED